MEVRGQEKAIGARVSAACVDLGAALNPDLAPSAHRDVQAATRPAQQASSEKVPEKIEWEMGRAGQKTMAPSGDSAGPPQIHLFISQEARVQNIRCIRSYESSSSPWRHAQTPSPPHLH